MLEYYFPDYPVYSDSHLEGNSDNYLKMELNGYMLDVEYSSRSRYNPENCAVVKKTVDLSTAICDLYTVKIPFEVDGFENSGVLYLTFSGGNGGAMMMCTVSDLNVGARTIWSIASSNNWMSPDM